MLVPMSWLRSVLPTLTSTARETAAALIRVGLEVERVEQLGVANLVVAQVLTAVEEPQRNGKTIRWCTVDVGQPKPRGIVCGAPNVGAGDVVVVALPGAVLPGDFMIARRKTYGHWSDGMICSERELGLGDEHAGILVLDPGPDAVIGADAAELLELTDEVLDIAVTPDRGYALSMRGIAREVAVAMGLKYGDPGARVLPERLASGLAVTVAEEAGCDRYVALTIDNLDPLATSPTWLQRRLSRAGMRPVSLAVDVTNHTMLELGQPLHAFDADRLTGGLLVRRATAGEVLTTLDGRDRALLHADLVIADAGGAVALAGVMGGARTEITAATRRVVLESAHFDAASVARTARRLRLPSEASRRFERGVDPALAPAAAAAAAALLAELGGAAAVAVTDVDRRPRRPTIGMRAAYPGEVAGRPVASADVVRRLGEVGCGVTDDADSPGQLAVIPPPWRPDLVEPVDLVEEVLRLEGYDTLPSRLPQAPAGRGLTRQQRLQRSLSRALAAAGFVEVQTSPFVGADALGLPDDDPRRDVSRVANPLSAEEATLRSSLLPGLLAALVRNVSRGRTDVALYETGSVFGPPPTTSVAPPPPGARPSAEQLAALQDSLPPQPQHAAVVLCGAADPAGWWGHGRPAQWSDAVAAALAAGSALRVELTVTPAAAAPWHPGRCAALSVAGAVVGYAGELHPRTVDRLGLPPSTCAAEIALEPLFAAAPERIAVPAVSDFPAGTVDVALLVADTVDQQRVATALRAGAGPLLESLALFDLYRGAPVPAGSRSLAYALTFRAPDRTLGGEEVNALRDSAIAAAATQTGAQLRA